MSVSRQLTRVAGVTAVGGAVAGLATRPALRALLLKWSGLGAPGGGWRLMFILLLLSNLKNLPLVWHIRFFPSFFYHIYFQPTPIPPHALFQPTMTATRSPLMECDYNLHKSNSTYFSDMDISRAHLYAAILRNGIRKEYRLSEQYKAQFMPKSPEARGATITALGGVSCFFKREIPPYVKFEMWTRLLTWDRKWFYLVTHLVKPGVAKPPSYTLQPWRKVKGRKEKERVNGERIEHEQQTREKLKNSIYASGIARYVIKEGRLTVSPEKALIHAGMVPEKPEGWVYKDEGEESGVADDILPASVTAEDWTWDVIEKERRRGLRFAEMFTQVDGLHDTFDGGRNGALGSYFDL